jgi:gliding motility-associated-like protein
VKSFFLIKIFAAVLLILPCKILFAQGFNNIEFVENKGQWNSLVKYTGEITNGAYFLRNNGFTVLQHNPGDFAKMIEAAHGINAKGELVSANKMVLRSHAWNVDFIGASDKLEIIPEKPIATYNNYFIGNDSSKWASNCKIFQAIVYKNVYPNIDIRYYTDREFLKYDIIVRPGGDVSAIALKYTGADKLSVKNQELIISTSVGQLKESAPFSYQAASGGRLEIKCKYVLNGNTVRFDINSYDHNQTLVIDPVVVFGSFCGGTARSFGFTATYGADGSMYGGGRVYANNQGGSFPVSPGAFQSTMGGGGFDIGIIKLNSSGTNRIYATYIGGSGNDQPHSLIVDSQGNLVIAGRTDSGNFPLANLGLVGPGGLYDIIVTKLNANGTNLVGSCRIGGTSDDGVNIAPFSTLSSLLRNYGDDGRSEVIVDQSDNIYVASSSRSINFPVTAGCFQPVFGGKQDAVILKFDPTISFLEFATYFGGSENDAGYVLARNPGNNQVYFAGGTESPDLPGDHSGTIGTSISGIIDGYIGIISPNGSVSKSTYIGTNAIDQIYGIQFDRTGFPYIMGQTTGNWRVINAVYNDFNGKQFIAKLQPDLGIYIYSTSFGTDSPPNISPVAFLVDYCENVYISGFGGIIGTGNQFQSAGTSGLPVTPNAFKSTTDGKDFYFFVLKKDAAGLLFASFYGEDNPAGFDHVDGGTSRFDSDGNIYQAICGNCNPQINPLPSLVTSGSWSSTNTAGGCNLTMVKIAMQLAGVQSGLQSSINGVPRDTVACVPVTVDFTDTIGTALSYEWHFNYVQPGGGPPDVVTTNPSVSHTYSAVGTYLVMLVSVDPTSCNLRDSSFIHITVSQFSTSLDFNFTKLLPCTSYAYSFTNTSLAPQGPAFSNSTFIWDFGDGSPLVTATGFTPNPVTHTFPGPGTYNVKLKLADDRYCDSPDSLIIPLGVGSLVTAAFATPAPGCSPFIASFKNNSTGGQTWLWDFGDGNTSTDFEPSHVYTTPGIYSVRLIAYNPNTCNGSDTSNFLTVTVLPSAIPDFSISPLTPQDNVPFTFTNLSSPDAVKFRWRFGDGDSLITTSRAPVLHQYNTTGTYNVCLTAFSSIGCDSTTCKTVKASVIMVADVPSAFTPTTGDQNSILYVRGFGIVKSQFTIWNRWGQKVFESADIKQGWDGKINGALQAMDVYAYTLNVEFADGTKLVKKGDITLIR